MKVKKQIVLILVIACFALFFSGFTSADLGDLSDVETSDLYSIYEKILAEICKREITSTSKGDATGKEILFRGIPWGSSADDFSSALKKDGINGSVSNTDFYSWEWEIKSAEMENIDRLDDVAYKYVSKNSILVAGYPVKKIDAYFHYTYDDNGVYDKQDASAFYKAQYSFDVVDGAASYEILKQKMISNYGACTEGSSSNGWWSTAGNYHGYIDWSAWYGSNDTGVVLWRYYEITDDTGTMKSDSIYICYGKSDSLVTMAELKAALSREQLKTAAESDNDGL